MKVTIEVPDALYRRVKVTCALEGRPLREVTEQLFLSYVREEPVAAEPDEEEVPRLLDGEPAPRWFGILHRYALKVARHDMDSVRSSIARGIVRERDL